MQALKTSCDGGLVTDLGLARIAVVIGIGITVAALVVVAGQSAKE